VHLIPGSLIRPGDVYVPVGDDGMAAAYDLTVASPVVESSLSSSARSVGLAADTPERRKAVHYAINCASRDTLYYAGAGDARRIVHPGGKDTQPPCGPHRGPQGAPTRHLKRVGYGIGVE
jgi:hypothetical protein